MELVPKHFCKDCININQTSHATCKARAVLTADPVTGDPVWRGLVRCSDRRTGRGFHECADFKEKQDD